MDSSQILKRIKKIEIITNNLVEEIFSGEYHSLFKGQGLEFSEVREYQPGDSFRQIDWNVSARMGHPYIKKFEETRELNVIFLVDGSASTIFGTRDYLKSEFITEVAAVLSFSAVSNNDKVGLLLFTDEIEKYLPPRKGKKTALKILRDILYFEPESKKTSLANAFEYIHKLLKKRSIIFIISDFLDKGYEHNLKLLSEKHDVIALKVLDKADLELPKAGVVNVRDPETDEILTVNTSSRALRKEYADYAQKENEKLKKLFKRMKIDLVNLRTDLDYAKELRKFFKARIKRKTR